MLNYIREPVVASLKRWGFIAATITLLVSLLILFLYRFSYICLDPELCAGEDQPLIINQP
jgi:hypothetical protein